MELKDFIEKSLLEILDGVREAQKKDIAVAPSSIEGKPIWTERLVNFDIQVAVDKSGTGGIKVLSLTDLGGSVSKSESHRISFSIPVHMNVAKQQEND